MTSVRSTCTAFPLGSEIQDLELVAYQPGTNASICLPRAELDTLPRHIRAYLSCHELARRGVPRACLWRSHAIPLALPCCSRDVPRAPPHLGGHELARIRQASRAWRVLEQGVGKHVDGARIVGVGPGARQQGRLVSAHVRRAEPDLDLEGAAESVLMDALRTIGMAARVLAVGMYIHQGHGTRKDAWRLVARRIQ